jgi:hypothetical protein
MGILVGGPQRISGLIVQQGDILGMAFSMKIISSNHECQ